MTFLVRKIVRGKWLNGNDICETVDEVSADAITNCIRTSKNTLSTWSIKEEQNIEEAILAIVSNHKHLDAFDVVFLDFEEIKSIGIEIKNTPGITPVESLKQLHFDLEGLNYKLLGGVSDLIIKSFKEERVKRYTRGQLKKILENAIKLGKLNGKDLNTSVLEKLNVTP